MKDIFEKENLKEKENKKIQLETKIKITTKIGGKDNPWEYNKLGIINKNKKTNKVENDSKIFPDLKERTEIKANYYRTKINQKNKKEYENNKRTNNIIIKKTTYMNYKFIFKILVLIDLFIPIFPNNTTNVFYLNYSNITFNIKGIWFKNIFGNDFNQNNYPNEIYINGKKQKSITLSYNFTQEDNFVELKWNKSITSCRNMFKGCRDITEFDVSNFNTSKVTDMAFMFMYCSSLTSLNITNFDTSKVIDFGYTFHECSSLTSLDLSKFDTSEVKLMGFMFQHCISLTSLNLSNFNTSKALRMRQMFRNCTSLTYLDLSNFDTSKVTWMYEMFDGCINLEYINLKNFTEISLNDNVNNYSNIFRNIPENVVICIDENNTKNKIFPQIKKKSCYLIDCSENWKSKKKN